MSMTWDWNGARWWKFDFHTHTPKSYDYVPQDRTAKEWLLDSMRAGLDCIAVTDHNTGAWIDEVKNAEAELEKEKHVDYRKLYIFPGVEISVHNGVHLLAIFDPSKATQDIAGLIGACRYLGTQGKSDAVTEKSFLEVVDEITRQDGIAIPAHADKKSGLFHLTGKTLQQALSCEQIFALEISDSSYLKPGAYTDAKKHWTEIVGSDAHHPSGSPGQQYPGSRFTWVKMGTPDIKGLRLALLDGSLSVLRSDAATGNPNEHADQIIESIEISGARYIGKPQPFVMGLNPWMNAVIGGRGTGKSTVVEFLRIALRREDELPNALTADFEKYRAVYADRDESGLLTNNAVLRAVYRKDGVSYHVQWSPDGSLDPIQQQTAQGWSRAEGDIRQRFPVRMYSQKQVFQLANTPLALLNIINDAPEIDYASWKKRLNTEENQYLSLRAKIREIETGLAEESRLKGELEDVKRKLALFEQSGQADVLKNLRKRRHQLQAVESWEGAQLHNISLSLQRMAEEMSPETLDESPFDKTNPEDMRLLEMALEAYDALGKIVEQVKDLAGRANTVYTEWLINSVLSEWKTSVDKAIQTYETLREQLSQEGVANPAEYGILVQHRHVIEKQLGEIEERKKQVVKLKVQAEATLERVTLLRREITATRGAFLKKVLQDNLYVRITIVPYGAKGTVEAELRRLIQRDSGGFEKDIGLPDGEGLLGDIYGDGPDAENVEKRLATFKKNLHEIARNPQQAQVSDKRFATHMAKLPPEALDRLDLWLPEDSLYVEYRTPADSEKFRSIHEGSPGQKTAALLAFLLSYGNEPLILDQPEDDLDNQLIYDLIVTQLREIKHQRQVIVITHNANIVVNGDAEYVVTLTARGGQSYVEAEGCLQNQAVRQTICNILEGGKSAFEKRYCRIALEGRHVR